jgi:hypothetical protein
MSYYGITIHITDKLLFDTEMQTYKDAEFKKIQESISKMMLFKEGDIGVYEVFFNFQWQFMIMNSTHLNTVLISDANTLCQNTYTIDENELQTLNEFLNKHNKSFITLQKVVDCFTYSYKLLYDAKAFEQIITALEILFLPRGQTCKKEVLSKRVSVFLGNNDNEIIKIYTEIKDYYKYRSDSTHEGIDLNITKTTLLSLREYTRRAIKKYLSIIDAEISTNPSSNFSVIKQNIIRQLVNEVTLKINSGILPA